MNTNDLKKSVKMTSRDKLLKKHLNLEENQFYRANPCVLGQIDDKDKNLLRKYTEKECKILNGQLFLNGECKKDDINFSTLCSKKVTEKPLKCEKLGKNDTVLSIFEENKTIIKKIFNKDECKKLGGELVNDKYCLDKVNNIDWSFSCGEVEKNDVVKLNPWGKCIRDKKSGEECKENLDKKIKNLNLKYLMKNETENKNQQAENFKKCMKSKNNNLQCRLERNIMKEEDFKKLNNLSFDKDMKEIMKKEFIKNWKNKKNSIYSSCIKSGKEKKECEILRNLWGEITDYSMLDGITDTAIDNYQKKRIDEDLKQSKIMVTELYKCHGKNNKLRCAFNKFISELEEKKNDKLSKEELKNHFDNFLYVQKRDGIDVVSTPSHYLSENNNNSKFIQNIWELLIDYAMKENVSEEKLEKFINDQKDKFNKTENNFSNCLKTSNNFSCGIEYNKMLNQDKVSFKLSKGEILEDRNKFILDFVDERFRECNKKSNSDCNYLNGVWDKEFIDIVSQHGLTNADLNRLEKEKIEKLKKIVNKSKPKSIEEFSSLNKKCFIGISWLDLLQTILVLGLFFIIFNDALTKNK